MAIEALMTLITEENSLGGMIHQHFPSSPSPGKFLVLDCVNSVPM